MHIAIDIVNNDFGGKRVTFPETAFRASVLAGAKN